VETDRDAEDFLENHPKGVCFAEFAPIVSQAALRRLQDADLVLRMDYGDYRVQDDALAEWLRNQELED
jgi:hypothetical protein